MTQPVGLASAWHPRGEGERFERLLPVLREAYAGLAITLPPGEDSLAARLSAFPGVHPYVTSRWPEGRWRSLELAQGLGGSHVHYVDFDRLLRWVETRPAEWRQSVERVTRHDCLIIGRTPAAYATHPAALVQTEAISNLVVSNLLGQVVDASAGAKAFSRTAVECLLRQTRPERALGADGEWPLTLFHAGFTVDYMEVDGLDWEIPDQYRAEAANLDRQQAVAQAYDQDPARWAHRVQVAHEIVQAGLEADRRGRQNRNR
jgi:hypothetical protein